MAPFALSFCSSRFFLWVLDVPLCLSTFTNFFYSLATQSILNFSGRDENEARATCFLARAVSVFGKACFPAHVRTFFVVFFGCKERSGGAICVGV